MSRGLTVVRLAKVVEIVLTGAGLTVNQYRTLSLVAAGVPPLRELAAHLVMKPPNITALVDGLVARGLLVRDRHVHDRRRQTLALTAAGRRLLRTADRRCEEALRGVAALRDRGAANPIAGLDRWTPPLDAVASELSTHLAGKRGRRR